MPNTNYAPVNQRFNIIVFGAFILFLSLLGCGLAKYNNPCYAIPFGLLISVYGLGLVIVGLFSVLGSPIV